MHFDALVNAVLTLWNDAGWMAQLGLVAQAATIGLLLAALRRPSRSVLGLALIAAVLGLFGLSLLGFGTAEYVICGQPAHPPWCSPQSPGR